MNNKHIHVGIDSPDNAFKRFIGKWNELESGVESNSDVHINFEDFSMFLSVMTPNRIRLLQVLRSSGPKSIRALSKTLNRDYKNTHTDVQKLLEAELVIKNQNGLLESPWDVIEVHVQLVA